MPRIRNGHAATVKATSQALAELDGTEGEAVFSPAHVKLDRQADAPFLPKITLPEAEADFLTGKYQKA